MNIGPVRDSIILIDRYVRDAIGRYYDRLQLPILPLLQNYNTITFLKPSSRDSPDVDQDQSSTPGQSQRATFPPK